MSNFVVFSDFKGEFQAYFEKGLIYTGKAILDKLKRRGLTYGPLRFVVQGKRLENFTFPLSYDNPIIYMIGNEADMKQFTQKLNKERRRMDALNPEMPPTVTKEYAPGEFRRLEMEEERLRQEWMARERPPQFMSRDGDYATTTTPSTGGRRRVNRWVEHVKSVRTQTGCSYGEALKLASKTW